MSQILVGVIGAGQASPRGLKAAYEVGQRLAAAGAALVCGGLGGVMEAAAKGCAEAGGTVIGLLPGSERAQANPYVTYALPTGMGHARNVLIVHAAQALIAIEGEYGTLSEMAVALKIGRKVFSLDSRYDIPGLIPCESPEQAVQRVFEFLAGEENQRGEALGDGL